MTRWIRLLFASFLSAVACAPQAHAHPVGPDAPYTVRVESEDGRTLRTFHHDGQTFVLGAWGERYVIRIENHTGRRVEAVVSVDGRDVVSGRIGDYVRERGYLVGAWDEVVIEGFRKSHDEVAAFRFTDPAGSYSSRMGTPQNVGIIGVAFFPEAERRVARRRPVQPYYRHRAPSDERYQDDGAYHGRAESKMESEWAPSGSGEERSADSLGASRAASPASAPPAKSGAKGYRAGPGARADAYAQEEASDLRESARQNLGTEYGESLDSHVREVAFRRASEHQPAQLVMLRYDDRDGLLARGIRLERHHPVVQHEPLAFPGRFAPPPP